MEGREDKEEGKIGRKGGIEKKKVRRLRREGRNGNEDEWRIVKHRHLRPLQ
jgi:hypothetical protein